MVERDGVDEIREEAAAFVPDLLDFNAACSLREGKEFNQVR
jgi:hypothetical protein